MNMEIKTAKSNIFRCLIESLKECLTDVNFEFSPQGIRVLNVDNARTIVVHLKLEHDKFESYKCPKTEIVGVNMGYFFKIMKTVSNHDTITLFIEKNDENNLGIRIENADKNTRTTYKLKTLDLNIEKLKIPDVIFDSRIMMPSADFQKILRDMRNFSERVEIKCAGKQISFKCKGDYADQETVIFQNTTSETVIETTDDVIFQGKFNLDSLISFTKCTNLCNSVELFMKNDYTLIVRYKVGALGEIKFALTPIAEEK